MPKLHARIAAVSSRNSLKWHAERKRNRNQNLLLICVISFPDAAFLLTVGSFLLTVELFYLQLTILAFLLTIGAFLLTA